MRESKIESNFATHCKRIGVLTYKFTSPGRRDVPDRIVLVPKTPVFFIEFKAPGEPLRSGQAREIKLLRSLGYEVYVIDRPGIAESLIERILDASLSSRGQKLHAEYSEFYGVDRLRPWEDSNS